MNRAGTVTFDAFLRGFSGTSFTTISLSQRLHLHIAHELLVLGVVCMWEDVLRSPVFCLWNVVVHLRLRLLVLQPIHFAAKLLDLHLHLVVLCLTAFASSLLTSFQLFL